jgi:ATP-binding cassette subfamily B protein
VPVVLVAVVSIVGRTFPMFGEVQRRLDALNTVMHENLAAVRLVKAFARAGHETARFRGANERLVEAESGRRAPQRLEHADHDGRAQHGCRGRGVAGRPAGAGGGLQVGQLIAFLNYLSQTLMALVGVSLLVVRLSRAGARGRTPRRGAAA